MLILGESAMACRSRKFACLQFHFPGTYLDETGGVDENSCKECPEGYYCPESAQVSIYLVFSQYLFSIYLVFFQYLLSVRTV